MYIYTVKEGDTLAGVARRLGVPEAQLVAINRLPTRALTPGQALFVPSGRYVVQPGDTLYNIARSSGITLSALRQANPGIEALNAGQILRVPAPAARQIQVIGYLPLIDPGVTVADFEAWQNQLTYVAIFAYLVNIEGNLTAADDREALRAARQARVQPLMSIANMAAGGAFSPEIARSMLVDEAARSRLIGHIIDTVERKDYAGVDADIENIPRTLQSEYVSFLRDLKTRLGRRILNVAVPPKFDEHTFAYARGHDYAGIGRVADRVYIMNYEFHWVGGPPGPIAPFPQVRRVLQYAASLMPRQKILSGISTAAYDWSLPDTPENRAIPRSGAEALRLAVNNRVPIQYDSRAETPWFRYRPDGGQREVWFEDARSITIKLDLVRDLGLGGIGIWHLGSPLPQLSPAISNGFSVQKL